MVDPINLDDVEAEQRSAVSALPSGGGQHKLLPQALTRGIVVRALYKSSDSN